MSAFNDDILIDIFLCLPAKSLIRFMLVCKHWFSIIASHYFRHQHTRLHRHLLHRPTPITLKPSLLLCCLAESPAHFQIQQSPYGEKWVPYQFISTLVKPLIRGFSNGLFLLQCFNLELPPEDCHIYNPTTKELKRISLNSNERYRFVIGLNLAFDPLQSPHYKIICIRASRCRTSFLWRSWWRRCQIEVYESDTDAWKLCGEPFLVPKHMNLHQGIYWKGGIHWRGIYFDIPGNDIRKHPDIFLPADNRTEEVYDHYFESNDYLHYVAHFPNEKIVMVFELQSDYSEWSLKYQVDLDIVPGSLSVLSIIRQENAEDDTLMLHEPGKIMAYKFIDKSVNEIINFGHKAFDKEPCLQFLPQHTFQYIETLAPL